MIPGVEVRCVAGQHLGVVDGILYEEVLVVVAKEMVLVAEVVVNARNVLVIGLNRGFEVVLRASDLPWGLRSRKCRKYFFIRYRRRIEVGRRDSIVSVGHVRERIRNLSAYIGCVQQWPRPGNN